MKTAAEESISNMVYLKDLNVAVHDLLFNVEQKMWTRMWWFFICTSDFTEHDEVRWMFLDLEITWSFIHLLETSMQAWYKA